MNAVTVKICGLSTAETLEATVAAGADMAGFVFFEKSPRHIGLDAARELGRRAQGRIRKVALTVDASDEEIEAIVAALQPALLQLHGRETPARVGEVKARFGLPVMKAVGVARAEDVRGAAAYEGVADIMLLDAKPAPDASVPGGAGRSFDWRLLRNLSFPGKWLLSGGLNADNVGEALRLTGAPGVDVSSGVESARGVKDEGRIIAFIEAVRTLSSQGGTV
ncbi:MAG: phosphoribosylanthranilate isomerase [Methylocystis sp.]|nr:phosphoribosylanthranilate isomerase [Methylocystis sp.]MBI3274536.1 phosphoribosylanthranilate isomerase [Methylocystis sp.]